MISLGKLKKILEDTGHVQVAVTLKYVSRRGRMRTFIGSFQLS
jgi:hypothetical protein